LSKSSQDTRSAKNRNNPDLYLIDGNSLVYRAFYALPDTMKTLSGITTNAIYGFTNMLLKLLDDEPAYVAVAFDVPKPTFRHKQYSAYKATRQKAPESLREQMKHVKEVLSAFSIKYFEAEGYEADDIIATLTHFAEGKGLRVRILTGDKDSLQLVSENVDVLSAVRGISDTFLYTPETVLSRLGIRPGSVTDYKALAGDQSDNISGVPGIGEKTAVALINKFGDLDNIISNADKIEGKNGEKIRNNIDIARLSKSLATLVSDVPIKIDLQEMRFSGPQWPKILPLFEKFEFRSLLKKYGGQQTMDLFAQAGREKLHEANTKTDYKLVNDLSEVKHLIDEIKKVKEFSFDTETTSLDTFKAKMVGLSVSLRPNEASYLPADVVFASDILPEIKLLFGDKEIKKIGHNLKYDIQILENHGIEVKGPFFDTMLASYILDPTSGKHGLKYLGAKYLGRDMTSYEELLLADETKDIEKTNLEDLKNYACADADVTFQLADILKKEIDKKDLGFVLNTIENPLVKVLVEMERNGVSVDIGQLSALSKEIVSRLAQLEKDIHIICGECFNINSPKQLAVILFDKLKLPSMKKTKTGASTDASVLEALAPKFEIAQKLLEFRQLTKLQTTYVDVLPLLVNPKTGRIHTSFNQIITATGRLSSSNPNLQNIPIRTDLGARIRDAFVPADTKNDVILSADYSQIELRILAHLSGDPEMISDFISGKDIHSATAADIFGVKLEDVTKDMRSFAKTINFGIVYGMSPYGLARTLGIKKTEAEEYINKYFNRYKGVKKFMDDTILFARDKGYVSTLFGRRRYLSEINSHNLNVRLGEERVAINTPVQGTAADIIKLAMIKIYENIVKAPPCLPAGRHAAPQPTIGLKIILQIHDELVFECPKKNISEADKMICETMTTVAELKVPLKVNIASGPSWGQTK